MKNLSAARYPPLIQANIVLTILVVAAGIFVRYVDLATHFTHIDDIGVAATILQYKEKDMLDRKKIKEILRESQSSLPALKSAQLNVSDYRQYLFLKKMEGWAGGLAQVKKLERWGVLDRLIQGTNLVLRLFPVASLWTYAPLQFTLTPFFLSETQGYRQVLFWGRFPSFLFGITGLLLMLWFYQIYSPGEIWSRILALTLLVFSWENIIFAKQMSNYSLGVASAISMIILLVVNFKNPRFSNFLNGFVLALLGYAHYQIIFFAPAFFLALFSYRCFENPEKERGLILIDFLKTGFFYSIFILPLYICFLRHRVSSGMNYNIGPNQEFLFLWNLHLPMLLRIAKCLLFYFQNSILLINSNLAFSHGTDLLSKIAQVVLFLFFAAGVFSFNSTAGKVKKGLGGFFLMAAVTWAGLILTRKLALSPTRHGLVLLPFMAITIGEGFAFMHNKIRFFQRRSHAAGCVCLCLVTLVGILFFQSFPGIIRERSDPFDEKKITHMLEKFDVKTVIGYSGTLNASLMPEITAQYAYFDERFAIPQKYPADLAELGDVVAFLGHRGKLTPAVLKILGLFIEKQFGFTVDFSEYQIVFSQEKTSDVEIEFSKRTKNGPNQFFFYILKKVSHA